MPVMQQTMDIDQQQLEWCIQARMEDGESEEEARKNCEAQMEGREDYQEPKFEARDSEQGQGQNLDRPEVTSIERCVALRQDLYNESVETSYTTCQKMFEDPFYRHVFTDQREDAWAVGHAMHQWSYDHDPEWASSRRRDRREKVWKKDAIQKIIREIKSDVHDPMHHYNDSDPDLIVRAERVYRIRQGQKKREKRREKFESKLTVGNLYGKSKEQILREQRQPGSDFLKSRSQIVAEIDTQTEAENELRKLKRKGGEKQ